MRQLNRQMLIHWCGSIIVVWLVVLLGRPAAAKTFSDLSGHWSQQPVERAACLGLLNGYPDGRFRPDNPVSLLDALVLLMKTEGYSDKQKTGSGQRNQAVPTIKVPYGQSLIDQAIEKKVLPEDLLTAFNPDAQATRAQIAVFLSNLLQLPVADQTGSAVMPDDLDQAQPAQRTAIAAVIASGLMSGYPDGSFAPTRAVTRGEMAALISRLIDQNWAHPGTQRLTGWLRSTPGNGKTAATLELVNLQTAKKISLAQDLVCYANGSRCSLSDLVGNRVEAILNDKGSQVSYLSLLEKSSPLVVDEKVRGSVKMVSLGMDSYLTLNDLTNTDRKLPLHWKAVVEGSSNSFIGFQSLKTGIFVDAGLSHGQVVEVKLLDTKKLSGKVEQVTGSRLYLDGKSSGTRPKWFNNWDYARIVDKNGNSLGEVQAGDSVQVTYLDPLPKEIDDEIPLEIVQTRAAQ